MDHTLALAALCRVCGRRCQKWEEARKTKAIEIGRYRTELLNVYQIDVVTDDSAIHPIHICKSCVTSFNKPCGKTVVTWKPHDENCDTCDRFKVKGRRPGHGKASAKTRHDNQEAMKTSKAVESACDIILTSNVLKSSPTHKLQQIASSVIRALLTITATNIIQLPTGGSKLTLQKINVPRVPSDQASSKTIRRRSLAIQSNIKAVSCTATSNTAKATDHQVAAVLRSHTDLEEFFHQYDLLNVRIPRGHELLMKVQLGWSWNQMRKMKVWLKQYNIVMAAESVTRQKRAHILGSSQLSSEMLPFFFTEDDEKITKPAAMVYMSNVVDHIINTLDLLDNHGHLLRDKFQGRICIKIGGDHGGGSTKVWYEIMNVANPNSRLNTTVFAVYEATDSVTNLHIALDRYVDQINTLRESTWKGMPFAVWLCGDFAVDSRLLGLQGAAATYPCTTCHVHKNEMNQPEEKEERTLESIKADHQQVQSKGYTKEAKREHHSVSHEPFFNIPIHQICPPVLHINLGLWTKFYNLLVADVQDLGEKIADTLAEKEQPDEVDPQEHFRFYVHNISEVKEQVHCLEEQAKEVRDEAVALEYDLLTQSLMSPVEPSESQAAEIENLHKKANHLDEEASSLRNEFKLAEIRNPLVKALDDKLQTFKVKRQAYHGRSFVGNHVSKCLKEENYTSLLSAIVETTTALCPELEDYAVNIQMKYLLLFEQFAKCYRVYSSARTVSPQEIDQLESDINEFVEMFKDKFQLVKLTPKFHYLWRHAIPFMRRTGFTLGMFSEQGGEQLHAHFNMLRRRYEGSRHIQGKAPSLYHLEKVMEEHLVMVHPSMRILHAEE